MSGSFINPWTVALQAPPSMQFSRYDYWNELPFPSAGDLPDLGIKLASPALAGGFFTPEPQRKPPDSQQTFLNTKVNLSQELERTLRIPGHLSRGILEFSPPAPRDHFLLLREVDWHHILALGMLFFPKQLICVNAPSIASP